MIALPTPLSRLSVPCSVSAAWKPILELSRISLGRPPSQASAHAEAHSVFSATPEANPPSPSCSPMARPSVRSPSRTIKNYQTPGKPLRQRSEFLGIASFHWPRHQNGAQTSVTGVDRDLSRNASGGTCERSDE